MVMGSTAVGFIALAWVLRNLGNTTIIGILLATACLLTSLVYQLRKKKLNKIVLKNIKTTEIRLPKIKTYMPEVAVENN